MSSSNVLEPPPTLMGMMMSCNDLPSTAVVPRTPPSTARPASTWHSEVDTYTSAGSTAVGDHPVVINGSGGAVKVYDPASAEPRLNSSEKDSSDSVAKDEGGFVAIARPRGKKAPSPAVSSGWDRSEDDDSQAGSPPRSRKLGHIISISGLRRTLSQADLAPQRRPSRIRSAMSKMSRHWQQHFGPQAEEHRARTSSGTFEEATAATAAAR